MQQLADPQALSNYVAQRPLFTQSTITRDTRGRGDCSLFRTQRFMPGRQFLTSKSYKRMCARRHGPEKFIWYMYVLCCRMP
jgi:hypothetical protein